jgi:hypothetical protein
VGSTTTVAPPSATSTSTTIQSTATPTSTTVEPPTAPTSDGEADQIVPGTGSALSAPAQATTIQAEDNCHDLLTQPAQIATIPTCVTATGVQGTVTGTVEDYAHTSEADVWQRQGSSAVLKLQYVGSGTTGLAFTFAEANIAGDDDPKLIALQSQTGSPGVDAVDIVEETGAIVAHIDLGAGGEVGLSTNPLGLETWTAPTSSGVSSEQIVGYVAGAWRIVESNQVPASAVPKFAGGDGLPATP